MITIFGAGGVLSNEAVKLLAARKQSFRLVARHARPVTGAAETISADLREVRAIVDDRLDSDVLQFDPGFLKFL